MSYIDENHVDRGIMVHLVRVLSVAMLVFASSCIRSSSETWEDLKTAGRYMGRSVDVLCGKDYESRMLTSDEEFTGPYDEEFIPLKDSDLRNSLALADAPLSQPKGIPGQKGVPSLSDFYFPPDTLQALFHPVHFETDEYVVRDKGEVQGLSELAAYLKKNANVYLIVEGHADERASASYNMALGMRRSNYVRSFLVKQGVDQNRIYTVSQGKERPIASGHSPDQWKLNRRSEFKIYQK
jgi:peptidoglycan-associated lipoprotein